MSFETVDDVLEHFGVRGMRWGVRKNISVGNSETSNRNKNLKRAAVIGGVAVVATAGAVFASKMLQTPQAKSGVDMARLANSGFAWKRDNGPWNYSLPLTPGPGEMLRRMETTGVTPLRGTALKRALREMIEQGR